MPDTEVIEQPISTSISVQMGENAQDPFTAWHEQPIATPASTESTQQQQSTTTTAPAQTTTTATQEPAEETFDEGTYLKNNFGWDNAESAKSEIERLRALEKNPPREEIKFENEESKKLFDLIRAGKVTEARAILDKQDRLERLSQYDLSKPDQAADILKAHMRFKNPDLTDQEVDYYINKKFKIPAQPQNNLDLTDEENRTALANWEEQVRDIHQDMIIQAKLVKPELAQFKSQLVLPDIEKPVDPAIAEAQQKELQQWQASRENYIKALENDFKTFNGFSATYKDEDVEYQVAYAPTEEEKIALKEELKDFNLNEFFDKEWFDEKGNPKTNRIMSDLYFLKNRDKILQKFVGESARQRLAALKKDRANITVGTQSQGTFQPDNRTEQEKQEAAIWTA